MEKATIGRIVHYVLGNGEHRPAIIVRVWDKEFPGNADDEDGLNLQVFVDGPNDRPYTGVQLEPDAYDRGIVWVTSSRYSNLHEAHTWHWPEHVGDTHG